MAAGIRPVVFSTIDERFCTSSRSSGTKPTLTPGIPTRSICCRLTRVTDGLNTRAAAPSTLLRIGPKKLTGKENAITKVL